MGLTKITVEQFQVTSRQLKNLYMLYAVGVMLLDDKMQNRLELNWNTYGSENSCGTPHCWFGWYKFFSDSDELRDSLCHTSEDVLAHFGLTEYESQCLFTEPADLGGRFDRDRFATLDHSLFTGPAARIVLERRLEKLAGWLENPVIVEEEEDDESVS